MSNASTAGGREHADAPDNVESGPPILFPLEGNFSAVVPLSEVGKAPEPHRASPVETAGSLVTRGAARDAQDEHEEVTLVPARVNRSALTSRPRGMRPTWPVMIAALTLSVVAGLIAGAYLVKSRRPVETKAPAPVAEAASTEAAAATVASVPQPTVVSVPQPSPVASESVPETNPPSEANTDDDVNTPADDAEARLDKTSRDSSIPKRVPAADDASGRNERSTEGRDGRSTTASPSRVKSEERASERPARKAPPVMAEPPAQREAVRPRRATVAAERPTVSRTPVSTIPVSSPPASTKSKKVIQWP